MSLNKFRINFDPTTPTTGDKIGAQALGLRAGVSQSIGSKDNSGVEELRIHDLDLNAKIAAVSFVESAIYAGGETGLFILAKQTATEGALVSNGDWSPLQTDPSGRLRVVADLDFSSGVADDAVDAENPIKVGSHVYTQVSVLPAISADGDKANLGSDLYRRVYMNDTYGVGWVVAQVIVPATVNGIQLDLAKQAGRKQIEIQNDTEKDIFIYPTNAVTITNGYVVPKKTEKVLKMGEALNVFAITATGTATVNVLQAA